MVTSERDGGQITVRMQARSFGELFRLYRIARGWTQIDVANRCKEAGIGQVAQTWISDLENGRRQPNRGTVTRLARALGASRPEEDGLLLMAGLAPTEDTTESLMEVISDYAGKGGAA